MLTLTWGFTSREAPLPNILACVGPGWSTILTRLIADLEPLGWNGTVMQVKEKFGGLRFYIGCGSSEIFDRIDQAEDESLKTCEACGRPGELRSNGGWLKTLCPHCAQEQGYSTELLEEVLF